jgi:hypothetical protein
MLKIDIKTIYNNVIIDHTMFSKPYNTPAYLMSSSSPLPK